MLVKQLMSRSPITATENTKFDSLWKLIFEKEISGLPIVSKKNELLGIISEEDMLSKFYPSYEQYLFDPQFYRNFEQMEKNISQAIDLEAKLIMNKDIYTATEDEPIMKAAATMLLNKVNCLPVVKKSKGKRVLMGIICKGDIFSYLFKANIKKVQK